MLLDAHERLNAAGVSLQSATEPLDTSQPIGRFLMHLLASMAELEHGTIVERTNLVRGRAAQEGRWGGGLPPYGYRVTGEKHDWRLVVYKPEAGVVRRIFVLYTGGLGLGSLANLLNAEGVPAPYAGRNDLKTPRRWRGTPRWNHGVLSRILRNPAYVGRYVHRRAQKLELAESACPRIVDDATYNEAQRLLRERFYYACTRGHVRLRAREMEEACGRTSWPSAGSPARCWSGCASGCWRRHAPRPTICGKVSVWRRRWCTWGASARTWRM